MICIFLFDVNDGLNQYILFVSITPGRDIIIDYDNYMSFREEGLQ